MVVYNYKKSKQFFSSYQVNRISQADIDTEFIFNCQMGRGRTTTGMVIATLVYLNRTGVSGKSVVFCYILDIHEILTSFGVTVW